LKKLLALTLVALMAGAASAQPGLGMFFSDTEFTDETTDFVSTGSPFNAYIVLIGDPGFATVSGYEVGITEDSGGALFVLSVTGPNGWTNFGGNLNHLVGFQTPVPHGPDGTVLCTLQMLYGGAGTVTFTFGASDPNSIDGWNGPVIADATNPNNLVAAFAAGGSTPGPVATVNGDGVTPVEQTSLSDVKSLFQ